ncbi:MAG: hypothetical protein H0U44_04825 [Flavisolibacter sp.]|jgi:uncharacterized damage-inducible protein DinB|nr:hypothetical protein [Flavisolibacter sp.]
MKPIVHQLASYNSWANELLMKTILQLPEQLPAQEVKSSFPSIIKTMLHVWDAESIWWQRMKLSEKIIVPSEKFNGDLKSLSLGLMQQDRQWVEWVLNAQEHVFTHEFIYQNSKKEQFKQPVYQVLLHVFNHGTYHRGQLVNMLRQLGVDKIPATDFIVYSRKK